jgi:hypothetical protein
VEGLASWANEVRFWFLFCGDRIIYRQKEFPAILTKLFQGVMFDITLRTNDHISLLKSSISEPSKGIIMHFMCHRTSKFLSSDFNEFSHFWKKELKKVAGYGQ